MTNQFEDTHPTNAAFRSLYGRLRQLDLAGKFVRNERTGVTCVTIAGGYCMKLSLTNGRLPVLGMRYMRPYVAAAEAAWQTLGTQDPAFIMAHAPAIWRDFIEDGVVKCAYGYRWRKHFGRDQLNNTVECLRTDKTNRQLYVSAWDPARDGLGGPQPKNLPCPIGFHVYHLDGFVHMTVLMRSSDAIIGLPYDVMAYALTLDMIAASAGMRPGTLMMSLSNVHAYSTNMETLRKGLDEAHWDTNVEPMLPHWTIDEVSEDPNRYVAYVKRLTGLVKTVEWDPKPKVVV